MLFNLNFNDPVVAVINVVVILILILGTYSGLKKGFLQSSIRIIGLIIAIIAAYILKNPISVFLYTHLPFFKFGGLFKGVSVLNVIVYELIAFLALLIIFLIAIKIICKITSLVDKVLSLIFLLGIPNKILGAIVGFIESVIILYFVSFVFKFTCNFMNLDIKPSLVDDVVNFPVLKQTFGSSLSSLDEITSLALEYKDTKDKDEFNEKAMDILVKYKVITEENLQILIDSGKITLDESSSD